ncbi:uncharacterized protein LOC129589171 [Paramacrobiotus metropolitanus]|uniref:uncharacterized protein LOC129589171 n=1 Tax=Paramacrobiotus metropolitanus TaxID=2943436 RepID=UPI0024458335|nr:uncharacterized protein LOC129589171 [Paramacrobiotus metropolitanus]
MIMLWLFIVSSCLSTASAAEIVARRSIADRSSEISFRLSAAYRVPFRQDPGQLDANQTVDFTAQLLGSHPNLTCQVATPSRVLLYWERNNERVLDDISGRLRLIRSRQSVASDGASGRTDEYSTTLDIFDLQPEDAGTYRCVVQFIPSRFDRPVVRSVPVHLQVAQPRSNTEPLNLRIVPSRCTAGRVQVLWDPPTDASRLTIAYIAFLKGVDVFVNCRSQMKIVPVSKPRQWTVSDLKPGTRYAIDIVAIDNGTMGKHANKTFTTLGADVVVDNDETCKDDLLHISGEAGNDLSQRTSTEMDERLMTIRDFINTERRKAKQKLLIRQYGKDRVASGQIPCK